MSDILTLAQARAALGWPDALHMEKNAEISDQYIPLVTENVEAWCGRMVDRTEKWVTDASSPITTPWASATIKAVHVGDVELTDWSFVAGVLTITDAQYTDGDEVTVVAGNLPVPASVVKAAQIILAHLWNADHQGVGASSGTRTAGTVPVSFAMPARAEALLNPYWHFGGFR